jgi:SAM-dependent methyltransferase
MNPPAWICPDHREVLSNGDGSLSCPRGHVFRVVAGIPRFVDSAAYAESFGAQWLKYRRTQLDSYTGTAISRDRVRRCLGDELWNGLEGLDVLECGCGAGRFTEILLGRGAHVTSVDLSRAVEANQLNFPQGPNHRLAQADLRALPFPPGSFDVVFCLGVVQHTPDPEATLAYLYEQVKPGGWLVVDHYGSPWGWYTRTAALVRLIVRRLPAERSLRATERLVDVFLPLHRRAGRLNILLKRVSPVQSYYTALPELPDSLQREWALLDTHDALTDWYKHFRHPSRFRRELEALGLVDLWCRPGGNGVEARGRRPPPR